jgi:uncharacterized membrane protein YesL
MDKLITVGSLVLVSIVFILTSLPLFTIGASLSASYAVVWKMVCNGDNTGVLKTYFTAFKREFKQSTALTFFAAGAGAVLLCDLYFSVVLFGSFIGILLLFFFIPLAFLYLFGLTFLFPFQARYANSLKTQIKNAYIIGSRNFLASLLMILMRAAVFVIVFFYHYVMPPFTFALIIGGHGFMFYVDVMLVRRAVE